jgi:5-methylthioadenosine/S-adenosylhomocysteine deaminase
VTGKTIDSVLHGCWVIPVEPASAVLADHAVVISGEHIHEIVDSATARARHPAAEHVALDSHVLIPGLINAHTHAAMTLLRGLADDIPLMEWLRRHIWPAEQRWISEEFVRDGTRHALAEMLKSGTTCFNDMYFYPEVTAHAALECGMRAVVGLILVDFPSPWAGSSDEYLEKGLALHDSMRGVPLAHTAFAPHAPYSVSDGPLQRVKVLADELDIPVHIHVHETHDEIARGIAEHGERPLERLRRLGLLSPSLVAAHMVHLQTHEIAACAEAGAHAVHCPESNLKLASGFAPVGKMLAAGIGVALGTDGAASNNDLDMLGEMRSAALLAKGVSQDASSVPAAQVLRMATLNGAQALGINDTTGSLEPGKSADIVAVDLSPAASQPVYHPLSQLVYTATREQVSDVWIAGRRLLHERRLTTLDEAEILTRSREWSQRIRSEDADS